MDIATSAFGIMTIVMAWVTFAAWRQGNEKRDVALLGGFSGLCGAGAAIAALL